MDTENNPQQNTGTEHKVEVIETTGTDLPICGRCNKPKGDTEGSCNCGRPTTYSQEILDKTKEYIENCDDDEIQQTVGMSVKGTELFKTKTIVNLPTIEGLAYELKVSKNTIYEWEKIHTEFSDVIDDLRAKQAKELVNKGLSGDYNPTIAKVLLTKHGYREGIEQTGKEGKDLIPETISKEQQDELLALLINNDAKSS